MWLTGHTFIKSKIAEENAAFGGELSGHFFFKDNFYLELMCLERIRIYKIHYNQHLNNHNAIQRHALSKLAR